VSLLEFVKDKDEIFADLLHRRELIAVTHKQHKD